MVVVDFGAFVVVVTTTVVVVEGLGAAVVVETGGGSSVVLVVVEGLHGTGAYIGRPCRCPTTTRQNRWW